MNLPINITAYDVNVMGKNNAAAIVPLYCEKK
jgi:hypothetical protein